MIKKFKTINTIDTDIKELLAYATARSNVENELNNYVSSTNRVLYLNDYKKELIGCIGIKLFEENKVEITHIATKETYRQKRVASDMIDYIIKKYQPTKLVAETDHEAVGFYRTYGFDILSLGEKYPGVERFNCVLFN